MQTTGVDRAREMEVFAAVAQSGSFSAAGRMLDLTPSAVSRTIDRIEARLGVRLMLRTTRVLTLTAEGQTYLAAARRILADLDDAERVISDQGAPRGRVRVSASLAHGRQRVVPLLGEFARLYPHILIDFNLTDVVVDVAAGQADVAIRFGPLADSPLTARRLGETGRTIVASPEYLARRGAPQVPEDLHDHDCLNFKFPPGRAGLALPARRPGLRPDGEGTDRGQQWRDADAAGAGRRWGDASGQFQRGGRHRNGAACPAAGSLQSW